MTFAATIILKQGINNDFIIAIYVAHLRSTLQIKYKYYIQTNKKKIIIVQNIIHIKYKAKLMLNDKCITDWKQALNNYMVNLFSNIVVETGE